jgi:hypothetical protein
MRALQKDRRGYPVPFVVLRDVDGKPHFTINDSRRTLRTISERRCAICGGRLGRLLWFVGGPRSAFHEHGGYTDTTLHHECMAYAMQVCPYLAMGNYNGRIDVGTLDLDKLEKGQVLLDPTQVYERPNLMVAVATKSVEVRVRENYLPILVPGRPYIHVEFWQDGVLLPEEEGIPKADKYCGDGMVGKYYDSLEKGRPRE